MSWLGKFLRWALGNPEDGNQERNHENSETLQRANVERLIPRSGCDHLNSTWPHSVRAVERDKPLENTLIPLRREVLDVPASNASVLLKKHSESTKTYSSPWNSGVLKMPSSPSCAPSVLVSPKRVSTPSRCDLLKKATTLASDCDASRKDSGLFWYDPPMREAYNSYYEPVTPPSSSGYGLQTKLPVYVVPEKTKNLMENCKVPEVLKRPLSPSTYVDYFAALLHAEDYYIEKWEVIMKEFKLSGVTLKLHEEATTMASKENNVRPSMCQRDKPKNTKEQKKIYVEFEIDLIPERLPFLLSRDYVYLRRSGKAVEPFQGFLSKVIRNRLIHAEFGEDFHSQHSSEFKYDVTFSFNRVCLKRCHQAVAAAVDPSFQCILFPQQEPINRRRIPNVTIPFNKFSELETSAIYRILTLKGPQPYLLVGEQERLKGIINEAVLQLHRILSESRVLIVAGLNKTCDLLMSKLKKEIPDSDMFRANAAFREASEVPDDIFSSSQYDGECFTCPPQEELRNFKVIISTFISSFRLNCQGVYAGHFSHIFVVDACHATEPETMVTLTNLATESTAVVLAGSLSRSPTYVRSDIARKHGLKVSYFRRLLNSEPYISRNPFFVRYLQDSI